MTEFDRINSRLLDTILYMIVSQLSKIETGFIIFLYHRAGQQMFVELFLMMAGNRRFACIGKATRDGSVGLAHDAYCMRVFTSHSTLFFPGSFSYSGRIHLFRMKVVIRDLNRNIANYHRSLYAFCNTLYSREGDGLYSLCADP